MIVARSVSAFCLAAILGVSNYSEPAQAAAINLTQIDFEYDGSPWTLGWKFSVSTPYAVTSLGVYDSGQDGLAGSAQVGLWLASGGTPLAQATVAAGAASELDGHFRFTSITPTTLNPGTEYIVGSYLSGELATALFGGNGLVDPHITVIDVRYSTTSVFAFPGVTDGGTEGAAFLGGNFRGGVAPVPLPAAAWLFGSSVAGLIAGARIRCRRPRTSDESRKESES
ncbi:MAG: DUF4082 domain-containing protein [Nitrospirota bacterium]|nr:DUF4082 domain-containing protein [Nitrospirota bacterium]